MIANSIQITLKATSLDAVSQGMYVYKETISSVSPGAVKCVQSLVK